MLITRRHADHFLFRYSVTYISLQCFDAVGWVTGRASSLSNVGWGVGMLMMTI